MKDDLRVRYDGNDLSITSAREHSDCKLLINGQFSLNRQTINVGSTIFALSDFSTSSGERFNVFRLKMNQIMVACVKPRAESVEATFR